MKKEEDKIQSIKSKLSNISKEQNISYRYVSTNFFIERMVARILTTSLKDELVFKGGYVGLRVYNSKRYTIDLDAVLKSVNDKNRLSMLINAIESNLNDGVWFKFERQEKIPLQANYGGIKQVYRTGLGKPLKNLSKAAVVELDISFNDVITPEPLEIKTSSIFDNLDLSWKIYPIEAIIAEKLHAFIARDGGSSRAKDLYDLSFYLPQADKNSLKLAIKNCFEHRKTHLPDSIYKTMNSYDFLLVKKSWNKVTSVISEEISFDQCLNEVLKTLKKINL